MHLHHMSSQHPQASLMDRLDSIAISLGLGTCTMLLIGHRHPRASLLDRRAQNRAEEGILGTTFNLSSMPTLWLFHWHSLGISPRHRFIRCLSEFTMARDFRNCRHCSRTASSKRSTGKPHSRKMGPSTYSDGD
jgi:hypothetical protein